MFASGNDRTDIVKLLLEQEGIDINAQNNKGNTAVLIAAAKNNNAIVQLFNEKGVTYDIQKLLSNNSRENILREVNLPGDQLPDSLISQIPRNMGHCTFEVTGYNRAFHEKYYLCNTCGVFPPYAICKQCAKICHMGHNLIKVTPKNSEGIYCECGAGHCLFPCKIIEKNERKNKSTCIIS